MRVTTYGPAPFSLARGTPTFHLCYGERQGALCVHPLPTCASGAYGRSRTALGGCAGDADDGAHRGGNAAVDAGGSVHDAG